VWFRRFASGYPISPDAFFCAHVPPESAACFARTILPARPAWERHSPERIFFANRCQSGDLPVGRQVGIPGNSLPAVRSSRIKAIILYNFGLSITKNIAILIHAGAWQLQTIQPGRRDVVAAIWSAASSRRFHTSRSDDEDGKPSSVVVSPHRRHVPPPHAKQQQQNGRSNGIATRYNKAARARRTPNYTPYQSPGRPGNAALLSGPFLPTCANREIGVPGNSRRPSGHRGSRR